MFLIISHQTTHGQSPPCDLGGSVGGFQFMGVVGWLNVGGQLRLHFTS